ncbi:hypothetical protein HYH03_004994 [Edaphochlamys debaryana]|uniref:Uncharacterized protein n=1 Tax=Edaphochlamys debaryana TaxID=47281 RepID=A0A836C2U4_9CHLO|nr:hypothetical protein HYH03_004994 [Edaphochlamys debaryana]|eukprot:KAG2496989.1 hypothetical protein HYH03_004994 [Edaphochlamys debaryana]
MRSALHCNTGALRLFSAQRSALCARVLRPYAGRPQRLASLACTASAAEPAPQPQRSPLSPDHEPRGAEPAAYAAAESCWDWWLVMGPGAMLVLALWKPIKEQHEQLSERLCRKAETAPLDNPNDYDVKKTVILKVRQDLRKMAGELADTVEEAVEFYRPIVGPLYDTPAGFMYGVTQLALLAAVTAASFTMSQAIQPLSTPACVVWLLHTLCLAPLVGLGAWYVGVGVGWWALRGAEARARALAEELERAANQEREGWQAQGQAQGQARTPGRGAPRLVSAQRSALCATRAAAAAVRPRVVRVSAAPRSPPEASRGGRNRGSGTSRAEPAPPPASAAESELCWDRWLSAGPDKMRLAVWTQVEDALEERYRTAEVVGKKIDILETRQEIREHAWRLVHAAERTVELGRPVVAPLYDTPAGFMYGMTVPTLLAAGSVAAFTSPQAVDRLSTPACLACLTLGLTPLVGLGLWYVGVRAAWWAVHRAEARARSLAEEYERAANQEDEGGQAQAQGQARTPGRGAPRLVSAQRSALCATRAAAAAVRPRVVRVSAAPRSPPEASRGGRNRGSGTSRAEPAPPPASAAESELCWDRWLSAGPGMMVLVPVWTQLKMAWVVTCACFRLCLFSRMVDVQEERYGKAELDVKKIDILETRQEIRDGAWMLVEGAERTVELARPLVAPLYDTPAGFMYGMTVPTLLAAGSVAAFTSPQAVDRLSTPACLACLALGLTPLVGLGLWYVGVGVGWWAVHQAEELARAVAEECERAVANQEGEGGQAQAQAQGQ